MEEPRDPPPVQAPKLSNRRNTPMSNRTLIAIAAAGALAALAAPALAKPAPEFLKTALQGDNSEIALGRLAETRAASPGVRDFGRTLEQDHSQARTQALDVAHQLKVPPTEAMAPQARHEEAKLRRLSGAAFDREFVRYMVQDHKKDIHDFEEQAKAGGPTAQLAQATLPTLHKHLDMAEKLEKGGK
jgi:putative membrane protein